MKASELCVGDVIELKPGEPDQGWNYFVGGRRNCLQFNKEYTIANAGAGGLGKDPCFRSEDGEIWYLDNHEYPFIFIRHRDGTGASEKGDNKAELEAIKASLLAALAKVDALLQK